MNNSKLSIHYGPVILYFRIANRHFIAYHARYPGLNLICVRRSGYPADAKKPKVRVSRKPSASLDSCITQGYAIMSRGLWSACIFAGRFNFIRVETRDSRYGKALSSKIGGGRRLPEVYGIVGYPVNEIRSAVAQVLSIITHFPRIWKSSGYIRMITTPTPLLHTIEDRSLYNVVWKLNLGWLHG